MKTKQSLNKEERIFLLNLARSVIGAKASSENFKPEWSDSEILNTDCGVFVTLNKNNELRGCIGYVEGIMPLQKAVCEMAEAAAFADPRFPSVKNDEVDDLDIEISVLSPLQEINDISEIEVGVHGLIVQQTFYKGLLLPQVAVEYGWDRETFLEHTCVKAGLSKNAWKDETTTIKIFSAEIFSEKEL
jgi:AmmeMemoRadiSam system protein A